MVQRMPSCIGLTHRQIWNLFRECYGGSHGLREHELREIHQRWISAAAYAGFVRKRGDLQRQVPVPDQDG